MQITAELDHQHIEKLQALEKLLNKNTSEVIAFAIDEIYNIYNKQGQHYEPLYRCRTTNPVR